MVFKGYRLGPLLKKTGREVLADSILGLAAQTAYYFFLSLFPLMLFMAPMLGVVGDKRENFQFLLDAMSSSVPGDAHSMLTDVVRDVIFTESAPGLMSVGALLAIWSGSNIFSALIDALNRAYDVKETRRWWKRKLLAVAAVLVAGLLLLVSTVVILGGEDIAAAVGRRLGLGETVVTAWQVVQPIAAFCMLVALAWGVFYFLPNVKQSKRQVLVGAVTSTVLWLIVTLLFRFYVQNFASYNRTYGAIGGVIVLLTWMYLSMFVLLTGGELNSEIHLGTGALEPRRGATLVGRVVTEHARSSTAPRGRSMPTVGTAQVAPGDRSAGGNGGGRGGRGRGRGGGTGGRGSSRPPSA